MEFAKQGRQNWCFVYNLEKSFRMIAEWMFASLVTVRRIGQHQWAFARVNLIPHGVVKHKRSADKDLWAKVPEGKKRGIKSKLKGGGKKK